VAWLALSLIILVAAFASRAAAVAVAALLCAWLVRGGPGLKPVPDTGTTQTGFNWHHGTLAAAGVGGLMALVLAFPALRASASGYGSYDAAVWIDAPFHASYVSAIATALRTGEYVDIHGRGLPVQLYHFGAYAIPALIKSLAGTSSLALTQIFTAWNGIWLAVSAYALASCFVTRPAVAWSAAMIALAVPDPGMFSAGHPAFGFHWLLQVASASGIGLSLALIACAVMVHAARVSNLRLVLLAWALTALLAVFKGQLFIVVAIPMFAYPAVALPGLSARLRGTVLCVMLACVASVTWLASHSASLPLVRIDFSSASQLLEQTARYAPEWQRDALVAAVSSGPVPSLIALAAALTGWMYGMWLIVWLVATVVFRRSSVATPPRPLLVLAAVAILLALGFAADNRMATGGPFEAHLQGQIWGYACMAIAVSVLVTSRVAATAPVMGPTTVVALALVALSATLLPGPNFQRASPIPVATFRHGPSSVAVQALASSGDVCGTTWVTGGDPYFIWQAALEGPSWVVDYALNPNQRAEVSARLDAWRNRQGDVEPWLRANGISRYIIPDDVAARTDDVPQRTPDVALPGLRAWHIAPAIPCRRA
jgi:hypothetical protein